MINNERENRLFPCAASIYVTCVTAHSQTLFRSWLQEIVYFFRTVAWGAGAGGGSGFGFLVSRPWEFRDLVPRVVLPWCLPSPPSASPTTSWLKAASELGFLTPLICKELEWLRGPSPLPVKPLKQMGLF